MGVTTLAVALISVGGTLGGAMFSERTNRKREEIADRQRVQERDDRVQQARRDLYARVNTTARAYRVAARDAVRATERGESVETAALETAKEAWAEEYSQAQMALPKDLSEIASALNRALGVGYSVVKQLPSNSAADAAYNRANAWFDGPLSEGVYLLRIALRHDLGVETQPDFETTRLQAIRTLDRARESLEHQLNSNR
ncbi:hypothetical protein [Streptomyces sp. NPDC048720]|uniref:hypothetical protein n=1 Tax=Streptomyces sp. NPDC048720 TaxID=3365588 RepID=UPI003720D5CF